MNINDLYDRIHFQNNNPSSDFRAGGLCSLEFMNYFAVHHKVELKEILKEKYFSFVLTCINLSFRFRLVLYLTNIINIEATLKAYYLKGFTRKQIKHFSEQLENESQTQNDFIYSLLSECLIFVFKKYCKEFELDKKDENFVKINSRDLEQKYVGETEAAWRDVFEELKENQPSILMIDEIDSLMGNRDKIHDSDHNSYTSTVAQLLQSVDELEKTDAKVWIIGTTNRPQTIDPAIKRSGRLGDMHEVKRPNEQGCEAILNLYTKKININENFDRKEFSKKLYENKLTGADISVIVNNARDKMYERCGIFDKMENGTFKDSDLKNLVYDSADFELALDDIKNNKQDSVKI